MLKIALTKSSSKDQLQPSQNTFKLPEDSSKLEKQLKSFITKLQSGSILAVDVYRPTETQTTNKIPSSYSANEITELTPASSRVVSKENYNNLESEISSSKYGSDIQTRTNENDRVAELSKEPSRKVAEREHKKPFASSDVPTFEDLMQSDEFKGKTQFNFDSDDD